MNKDYTFGIKPVEEAIRSGKHIDKILIQRNIGKDSSAEIYRLSKEYQIPFQKVPVEKLNRVTRKNHQGVIAFFSAIPFSSLENAISLAWEKGKDPLLLILDRVTDIRNFGAIARTAECLGVDAIVIPARGGAAINADALKTSAGALQHIPVCREKYLTDTIDHLRESGIRVFGMSEKVKDPLYQQDLKGPVALLMGSEEDGIAPELYNKTDGTLKIPMTGKVSSLNVGISAGIGLYEIIRQRNQDQ